MAIFLWKCPFKKKKCIVSGVDNISWPHGLEAERWDPKEICEQTCGKKRPQRLNLGHIFMVGICHKMGRPLRLSMEWHGVPKKMAKNKCGDSYEVEFFGPLLITGFLVTHGAHVALLETQPMLTTRSCGYPFVNVGGPFFHRFWGWMWVPFSGRKSLQL